MEIKDVVQVIELVNANKKSGHRHPFKVGQSYFIRSVTHYYTGRLKEVCGQYLILEDAAWIADTGRFHEFLKDGKCSEYEGFTSDVIIPVGGVIDVTEWKFPLLRGQK